MLQACRQAANVRERPLHYLHTVPKFTHPSSQFHQTRGCFGDDAYEQTAHTRAHVYSLRRVCAQICTLVSKDTCVAYTPATCIGAQDTW